jgi:dynein heavy chain
MKQEWLTNVLRLLPYNLKHKHQETLDVLSAEMREDYHMSVKKAIVDFVLKDPRDKGGAGISLKSSDSADSAENFVSIRSSAPSWQADYRSSFTHIRDNLFINPTVIAIFDIWHKFHDMRLFDLESILHKGAPFELRNFKTMLTQKIEKANEKLMTT